MFAGCRIKAVCKQFQIILVFFRPSEVFINNPIPIILQVPKIARAAVKKCSSKELPQKRKAEREMHPSQPSFYLICISWQASSVPGLQASPSPADDIHRIASR